MTAQELRENFLDYFKENGHKVLPSSSLVPAETDPTVLFTTAGMQQFKPYYSNPEEAPSTRITTVQKCIRTGDIDEVGDNTHLTFFEMLGNFSFGYPSKENSYFKKESIEFAWRFLTETLGFSKDRIYATYFEGTDEIEADKESMAILEQIEGLKEIRPQGKEDNFWTLGTENSPGGPTVEFYIDGVEIWNLVFNQYILKNGKFEPALYKGVDTGMGFERLLTKLQNVESVYETDVFTPIIEKIEEISGKDYEENQKAFRIIADHIKAATLLSAEGIQPSNTGQGYILRRLIRRAVRYGWMLDIKSSLKPVIMEIIKLYQNHYEELIKSDALIEKILAEEEKFQKTIESGLRKASDIFSKKTPIDPEEYAKMMQITNRSDILHRIHAAEPTAEVSPELKELGINITNEQMHNAYISGHEAFNLYQSYGFPLELITELAQKEHLFVGITAFSEELKKHQEQSRTASAGMFKGGLADASAETTRLHTAAHLLLAALRKVLGESVTQKGANITPERLRFDFAWGEKLAPEQITEIEKLVNENIEKDLQVDMQEMSLEDARNCGAMGVFESKYGQQVKVYTIGGSPQGGGATFSKEICGGPHVSHTGELGHFKILKEESSSAGVRRIKAILE